MPETPSLEDQVIVALRRITRAIDLHSRELLQQHGLTAPQLAALRAVDRYQPVTVGGLAKAIHLSQATVTGVLDRLGRQGLISRSRDGKDRRSVVVQMTDGGRAMLASAPSLLHDRFRRELRRLRQWEQTQMLATLQRIAEMMAARELDASRLLDPAATGAASEDVSDYLDIAVLPAEEAVAPEGNVGQ